MKRILAPILLLTLLFPAQGQSLNDWVGKGKALLCKTTGVGCPETIDSKDLVERKGVYFKKRTDIRFTGKTTGVIQASLGTVRKTVLGSVTGTMDSYSRKESTRTGRKTVSGSVTTQTDRS